MTRLGSGRMAVVPVRGGEACVGGADAVAEAGGHAWLVGDGAPDAAAALAGVAVEPVRVWDTPFAPARWAATLAPLLDDTEVVILPATPDGRDLAPRLAAELGRPLLANALSIDGSEVACVRWHGRALDRYVLDGPAVVTLQPSAVGAALPAAGPGAGEVGVEPLAPTAVAANETAPDPDVVEVLPADPTTVDLAEAPRIVAGGAGLAGDDFPLLAAVATALGASMGATRVVTDAGWVGHERQIGTTGVVVSPRVYVALGISGAVQHTAGLGHPEHVVAVNLDPYCPMMAMADLAVVTDAPALLRSLAARLGVREQEAAHA